MIVRSSLLRLVASLALAASTAFAVAQTAYPEKLIKLVVPFPAGGDLEPVARGLGEHFQKVWGQPYIVEHKAGAQAMIGTEYVARSDPDGHTLLVCSVGAMTINPSLYPKVPYKVGEDIVPVTRVATTPMVLVVGSKLPVKSYAEFVAYLKENPGKVSFASAGTGNVTHLTAELFMREAGLSAVHVPYKGAQAVIADLLGGHIEMYFNPLPSALGYLRQNSDKVTPLAVTSLERSPSLPEVPTLHELGMKGFQANSWYGLCAPGGTPKAITDKLAAEVGRALAEGELPDRLRGFGMVPGATTPEQFTEDVRTESAQWAKIIKDRGISIE